MASNKVSLFFLSILLKNLAAVYTYAKSLDMYVIFPPLCICVELKFVFFSVSPFF